MVQENGESRALDIFRGANKSERLSDDSLKLLEDPNVLKQIAAASGTPVSDLEKDAVLIVTAVYDDSGSMLRLQDTVIKKHRDLIDGLRRVQSPVDILISTQALNAEVVQPYAPLDKAIGLDRSNYRPTGGTPLNPRAIEVLGGVIGKAEEARRDMYRYVTATVFITDGGDTSYMPAEEVKPLVADLHRTRRDMIAGLAFDGVSGQATETFDKWGITSEWRFSGNSTPQEFAEAIDRFIGVALRAATANTEEDLEKIIIAGLIEAPKNFPTTL